MRTASHRFLFLSWDQPTLLGTNSLSRQALQLGRFRLQIDSKNGASPSIAVFILLGDGSVVFA